MPVLFPNCNIVKLFNIVVVDLKNQPTNKKPSPQQQKNPTPNQTNQTKKPPKPKTNEKKDKNQKAEIYPRNQC